MNSPRSAGVFALAILLTFIATDRTQADGKFFPRTEVADEPGITAQRAVIAYRDGIETLIVQSDVTGEGDSFGWLLPLPAEPATIEPCAPYTLHGIGQVIHPRMARSPTFLLALSIVLLFVIVVTCIDYLRKVAKTNERVSAMGILIAILGTVLIASILLPSLARARALGGNVELLQTTQAGVYEITVLKGTGTGIKDWLISNRFTCPPKAVPVFDDYAAKDWVFLAAKVSADADHSLTHHPLKVTFPTDKTIYPLRLTGVNAEPLQLDLYVIGDKQAMAAGLRPWFCDTFAKYAETYAGSNDDFDAYRYETPEIYEAETYWAPIGIPAVSDSMWPGCVLTRLHGRLDTSAMQDDLELHWIDREPMYATVYSRANAWRWSGVMASLTFAGLFAVYTWIAARKRWTWPTLLKRKLALITGASLLGAGILFATLDVVPVKERERVIPMIQEHWHDIILHELVADPPENPFPDAYHTRLQEFHIETKFDELKNPGDYVIEPAEEGWRLTVLSMHYVPITIPIAPDGVPIPAN